MIAFGTVNAIYQRRAATETAGLRGRNTHHIIAKCFASDDRDVSLFF